MVNNNPEMSLDEVLSSIKKKVIDTEPPGLELTDMVSENGNIVKVKSGTEASSSDMGAFLKLIQENANTPTPVKEKSSSFSESQATTKSQDKPSSDFLKTVATPLVREWINENLPKIVKEIAEQEIKKLLSRS